MIASITHNLLAGRTSVDMVLWGAVFLLILAGMGWAVWREKQRYQALGKQGGWLWLRLLSRVALARIASVRRTRGVLIIYKLPFFLVYFS